MRKVFGRLVSAWACVNCHHPKTWHKRKKADTSCQYPVNTNKPCTCAAYTVKVN